MYTKDKHIGHITAVILAFCALSLLLTAWGSDAVRAIDQEEQVGPLDQEIDAAGPTSQDIVRLEPILADAARQLIITQLSLDQANDVEVLKVVVGRSSARVDVRLVTSGVYGVLEEIIHVFALHQDGEVTHVFREPSPEFHLYAGEVSSLLLPASRLEYWTNLRLAEEENLKEGGNSLYLLPFDGGTQRFTAQDWDKHFDFAGSDFRVRAARGGAIIVKRASQNAGGCSSQYIPYDNYVKITHQDGTFAWYLHQKWNSIPDFPGGTVQQGDCLGLAGQTGWACGPHLHFNISRTSDNSGEPDKWDVPSFAEGLPKDATYSPVSKNRSGSCTTPPPPGDTVIVNPPPINPSAGTCNNGWNQISGYAGQPAYTTRNAQISGQSTNSATWIPNIGQTGAYGVEVYVPDHTAAFCSTSVSYDTSNAVYTLTDSNNKTFTKSVDQKPLANIWVYLGDLYCNAGQSCSVKLTDLTGEAYLSRTVSFSAVRFTLKSTPPPTYSIGGSVSLGSGSGLGGVTVSAAGKTVQTDNSGNYVFSDLPAGTYTVTPSKAEYTFAPGSRTVTLGPNATGVNFTASPVTYSISGRVGDSADGSGISGAVVSAGGKTVQTDGNGNYALSGLSSGTYTVSVSKSGYSFNPSTRNVTLGPDASGVDFTGTAATYSIKGSVTAAGGALAGVGVSAGGKTAQTDSNGSYTIGGLSAGTYTVVPSKAGYSFTPNNRSITVGPDATGVDFVGSAAQVDGARLFIDPAQQVVPLALGQLCVKVNVEKVTNLSAVEFELQFPPSFLQATSASPGPFLLNAGDVIPVSEIDNGKGLVTFGAALLGNKPGPSGAGQVASVCFDLKKQGSANVTLTKGVLLGLNGADIPVTLAGGSIEISSCYFADFDCDNDVDISDVQKVASRWGTKEGDPRYSPIYDLDGDKDIDIVDVQKVAAAWGWPNRSANRLDESVAPLTLWLDPASLRLAVGETGQYALRVAGAENLAAFEARILFDETILRVKHVELSDFLSESGRTMVKLTPEIDNQQGELHFGVATLGEQPGVSGSGVLAWIDFEAIGPGSGNFDLRNSQATTPDAGLIPTNEIDAEYEVGESLNYKLYLPAQALTPGQGWKIGQQVQNAGTDEATVEMVVYSANGSPFGCGSKAIGPGESANYQSYAECGSAPWPIGSGVITVDQPSVAIANISNWGVGSAGGQYRSTKASETSKILYFPLVKLNHYGRTTTFQIQNAGDLVNRIEARFTFNGVTYQKVFDAVPPNTTVTVGAYDVGIQPGNGQVGSLSVTGSEPLAGVSVEHEHNVGVARNLQASRAFLAGDYDRVLYCPLFRNAHLAVKQTTGAQVQNVTNRSQKIEFVYTPIGGGPPVEVFRSVAPGESVTFYAPEIGIPTNSVGSVTLRGEGDIAAVVNDHGYENGRETTTTYSCFGRKNLTDLALMPLYKEFFLGNTTGLQVQNAADDGSVAHITATYYPIDGSPPVVLRSEGIPAGQSVTFWGVSRNPVLTGLTLLSGDPAKLAGSFGSVIVESNTPIAVIANESVSSASASEIDAKNYEGFSLASAP